MSLIHNLPTSAAGLALHLSSIGLITSMIGVDIGQFDSTASITAGIIGTVTDCGNTLLCMACSLLSNIGLR